MSRSSPDPSRNQKELRDRSGQSKSRDADEGKSLGETSDEYGREDRDESMKAMTEGQDIGMTSPDVAAESPGGMREKRPPNIDRGFADDRDRRDR
jgi:hypothetical protein